MSKKIAIIGAGPAGVLCAILLAESTDFEITLFDANKPLTTLIPTGGGRCNFTYYEEDNKEFVKNYPRGEKFLLSVFSQFNALNTIELFNSFSMPSYVQEDLRVFPISNSSRDVSRTLVNRLNKENVRIVVQNALNIVQYDDKFEIMTNHSEFDDFDTCVIATGGKGNGFQMAESLGHNVKERRPTLSAFEIDNPDYYTLSGLTLKECQIKAFMDGKQVAKTFGDILFTHKSISGPGIFRASSLCVYENFSADNPLTLKIKFNNLKENEVEENITNLIASNPNKAVKNILSEFIPKHLGEIILKEYKIDPDKEITHLTKSEKQILIKNFPEIELRAISQSKGDEIVTAGGVYLNEISAKTMESKLIKNLYFCGEILDIDGFTGGFNLQNCWSTAYVCAQAIIKAP